MNCTLNLVFFSTSKTDHFEGFVSQYEHRWTYILHSKMFVLSLFFDSLCTHHSHCCNCSSRLRRQLSDSTHHQRPSRQSLAPWWSHSLSRFLTCSWRPVHQRHCGRCRQRSNQVCTVHTSYKLLIFNVFVWGKLIFTTRLKSLFTTVIVRMHS